MKWRTLGVTTTWLVSIDLFSVFFSLVLDIGWALSIVLLFNKQELPLDTKLDVLLDLLIGVDLGRGFGLQYNNNKKVYTFCFQLNVLYVHFIVIHTTLDIF